MTVSDLSLRLRIFDFTGRVMLVLQDHKTFITDLAFSPDGR